MTWMVDWMAKVLPWGQPTVMMTCMVDWMVEVDLSYCRVVLSCYEYESIKCNIVIFYYAMNCYVGQVCWPRVLVIDHVYKGRVSLILINHLCEIICEVLV